MTPAARVACTDAEWNATMFVHGGTKTSAQYSGSNVFEAQYVHGIAVGDVLTNEGGGSAAGAIEEALVILTPGPNKCILSECRA